MAASSPRRTVCIRHFASGQCHWATISPDITFVELQSLVACMFQLHSLATASTCHIEYTDVDGDVVRIANDMELHEALAHLPHQACELVVKAPLVLSLGQLALMTWQAFVPALQHVFHAAEAATLAFLDQDGMESPVLRPRPAQRPPHLQPDSDTEPETDDDD